jgi:dihydroneopterin aldolase
MGLVTLSGMEFFAYHGCFAEEQIIGNKFIVDLEFFASTENAENTDDLTKTINYQKVYDLVKTEMEIKSKLIEHVARRILNVLYSHPPLKGRVDKVSFTLTRNA